MSNVPGASIESVSEHAIALYFAVRRCVVTCHNLLVNETNEWPEKGTLIDAFGAMPGTCKEDIMAIIGAGELGLYDLCKESILYDFVFRLKTR